MPAFRLAINTGGGDAPGLNAVIRAATLAAIERGWEVWGIKQGYRGLIDGDDADWTEPRGHGGLVPLDRDAVRGIGHLGGTILGTVNRGDPFHYPTSVVVDGKAGLAPTDRSRDVVSRFASLGFDGLLAIGGDGSMRIASELHTAGIPLVIGVPKTIDNDVLGTDITFGFDTAVSIATDAIDRLHTTTEAHERVMVVEVMGRHAGWIALTAGLAGGADVILLPEIPFHLESIAAKIAQRERRGRRFSIVVVAEGAVPAGGTVTTRGDGDAFRRVAILGGVAEHLAKELAPLTGKETRSMVLGHLQRGGSPSSADRVLAMRFAAAAINRFAAALEGAPGDVEGKGGRANGAGDKSGMIGLKGDVMDLVPFAVCAGGTRTVPVDRGAVLTARALGISLGDEDPARFLP
jgi:phosphofructokinase-like protein